MSTSIDQQFIEFVVKSLVGNPDAVSVVRSIDEKGVLLELTVDPDDLGRVIGKRGATAQSLRTLLRALGTKNDARYNLKIVDNSPEGARARRPAREYDEQTTQAVEKANEDLADDTQEQPEKSNLVDEDAWTISDDKTATVDESTDDEDEDDHSSVVSKTRKELEDLDDLDV
jgi:uncharacterized protein